MLEEQINDFIEYCKVSGFRDKSIESLSIRLNQFKKFLKTARQVAIRARDVLRLIALEYEIDVIMGCQIWKYH